MNKEWKNFLLQWILPIGIFGIVMIIVMSGFKTKITNSAKTEYESKLVKSTEDYAGSVYDSVQKVKDLSGAVSEVVGKQSGNWVNSVTGIKAIVDYSDAYRAIMVSPDGSGILDSGEKIQVSDFSYYKDVLDIKATDYKFVFDDEMDGSSAVVINVPVGDSDKSFFVYFPIDTSSVKEVVSVEKDYDSAAHILIFNINGDIRFSTSKSKDYGQADNAWESLMTENDDSTIRRIKTKAQSGNSGCFSGLVSGIDSLICYAPVPGTEEILAIAFNAKNAGRSEAKIINSSLKQLTLVSFVIILFIVTMLTINIVKITIDNKNKEELQDKADNDQLTGLKNKIATEREIKEYIQNHPEGIGMLFLIDIDNFKKINDTMGHAFGDEVLREIGRHIGVNFRVTDVIGRVGGDEFMVFLKNLKEDANTIKEAQKLTYFFRHFQVGDYVKYSVTASIGAAVFPAHGSDFASLYKSADAAVYKSKKRGKNQLSFFDDRDKTPEEVAYADSHLIDIERKDESTPIES